MAVWTDVELRSAVSAYLEMLGAQDSGKPYSKAGIRRLLRRGPLKARSEASIEYRMRNISAVLEEHGRHIVKGYVAAANVGEVIGAKIWAILREPDVLSSDDVAAQTQDRPRAVMRSARRPPIIYFHIGWMKRYSGPDPNDPTVGAQRFLKNHVHGAECFNFMPTNTGIVRGYRPPGGREKTDVTRLGAEKADQSIEGAVVVWLAKEPGSGRTLIVGWYTKATVFRETRDTGIRIYEEPIECTVEARVEDATLLDPIARTFEVRSSRLAPGAGFGQHSTWYGADDVNARVLAYIQSTARRHLTTRPPTRRTPPKNLDPELRRKVERAAVEHAKAYYRSEYGNSCSVVSVEAFAKGWDLEVHNTKEPLLIEVKGLLNSSLLCELTPNEYQNMMLRENRDRYVVYVVNDALAEPPAMPIASIFEHEGHGKWRTADGRELVIEEKTGAVLSCR